MDPQAQEFFSKAKAMVNRGQAYEKETNYQYAGKCYGNASALLGKAMRYTTKPELIQTLKGKVKKYQALAVEMLVKEKQKESEGKKKTLISRFGFPEQPKPTNNVSLVAPTKPMISTAPHRPPPNRNSLPEKRQNSFGLNQKDAKCSFEDIAGMADIKDILYEAVIIPQKRPDLFEGIRAPPRGILLYGPPGNGKTFITKALAKQSGCTFYGISAGSIVNKFVGQSEKALRNIFQTAKQNAPSIIFIDEIDSILTARSQSDSDSARRLKTQFLVQFDQLQGAVILIGATNLPNQLDLAALRRFGKLVYVGMPDKQARKAIIERNLKEIPYTISKSQETKLINQLEGYSASEITDVIKEASMLPLREVPMKMLEVVSKSNIRPVQYQDFVKVLQKKKPLLSKQDLKKYEGKFN